MNTQGWIRGLIAHNSPVDKFVSFVFNTISSEFKFQSEINKDDKGYIFRFDNYIFSAPITEIEVLQKTGPYALDKFILGKLKEQGLEFDVHRSQYIEYCYGLIEIK